MDTVEHLILVDSKEAYVRKKHACQELVLALKMVYSRTLPGDEAKSVDRGTKNRKESTWNPIRKQSSLGSIFIHRLTLHDTFEPVDDKHSGSYARYHSLPAEGQHRTYKRSSASQQNLRSTSFQFPGAVRGGGGSHPGLPPSQKSSSLLGKLDFSGASSRFVNSFLMGNLDAESANEETVQLAIEAESPFEKSYLAAKSDKKHQEYIDSDLSGLMHVPFLTLVHAAPILHSRTFSTLKGVAWDTLLSPDQELSQVAAAFFLLACAKETEKTMRGFVATRVLSLGPVDQRSVILRFKVLWDCRYGVWPRMEERAQKKLNLNDKEDKKEVL